MGCHALLQGIYQTQGSNLGLLCLLYWQVDSLPLVLPGKPEFSVTYSQRSPNSHVTDLTDFIHHLLIPKFGTRRITLVRIRIAGYVSMSRGAHIISHVAEMIVIPMYRCVSGALHGL